MGLSIETDLERKWKKENYFRKEGTGFFCYNGAVWEDIPAHRELFGGISFIEQEIMPIYNLPSLLDRMDTAEPLTGKHFEGVRKSPYLSIIPPEQLTEDFCYNAIKNLDNFYYVPHELLSERIIMEMISLDGFYMHGIGGDKFQSHHYLKAIETYGEALEFFPEELKTPENCLKAVKVSGYALEFVPEELRTREMCRLALTPPEKLPTQLHMMFKEVPFTDVVLDSFKEFVNVGVSPREIFSFIRPEVIDQPLVDEALKSDGNVFRMLPEQFKTEENAFKAVLTSGILAIGSQFWNRTTIFSCSERT